MKDDFPCPWFGTVVQGLVKKFIFEGDYSRPGTDICHTQRINQTFVNRQILLCKAHTNEYEKFVEFNLWLSSQKTKLAEIFNVISRYTQWIKDYKCCLVGNKN